MSLGGAADWDPRSGAKVGAGELDISKPPWETRWEVGHLLSESGTRHRLAHGSGAGEVRPASPAAQLGRDAVSSDACWERKAEAGSPAYSRRK